MRVCFNFTLIASLKPIYKSRRVSHYPLPVPSKLSNYVLFLAIRYDIFNYTRGISNYARIFDNITFNNVNFRMCFIASIRSSFVMEIRDHLSLAMGERGSDRANIARPVTRNN